ncbi:TIGR02270 family protein [Corallococcus llansteffanensis]|nr:TIGR02270 family protein [Corallococcus llansteffanensis]
MTTAPVGRARRAAIVWDVVEEHLSEADFLWAQWERLLEAPDHSLAEVREDDEPRLTAHLEGLIVGGHQVATRLLLPLLEGGQDMPRVCAAASALLGATDTDWLETLLERLPEGDEDLVQGLARALELSGREDVSAALLRRLPELAPERQSVVLDVLCRRQSDPGDILARMAGAAAPLKAAAVRAARFAPLALATDLVRQGLAAEEEAVRLAALETGLWRGLPAAWVACRSAIPAGGTQARLGLFALAVGGTAKDLEQVVASTREASLREEAVWALGFSGRLAAAEALLGVLKEDGSPLAAESFAAITGLPLRTPFVEEVEEPEPDVREPGEDTEEAVRAAEAPRGLLPAPAVVAHQVQVAEAERWWARERGRFSAEGRFLYGHPHGAQALLAALEGAPMRRRPALCLEVAIRSEGHCVIEPRAWTSVQHPRAKALSQVRPRNLAVTFEGLRAR